MDRPLTHVPAFIPPHYSRRLIIATVAVIVIHAAAIYAVLTGLAARVVKELPQALTVEVVRPPPTKPKTIPPPPTKPELQHPEVATIPPPEIQISVPPPPTNAVTVVKPQLHAPPLRPQPQATVQPPPTAPPKAAVQPTGATPLGATHTKPPYPPLALRLNEEGTVVLAIDVGTDGRVTGTSVVTSSGHDDLDQAAQNWVQEHWRYKPATVSGQPVATRVRASIVFNVKDAGSG